MNTQEATACVLEYQNTKKYSIDHLIGLRDKLKSTESRFILSPEKKQPSKQGFNKVLAWSFLSTSAHAEL